jgi:integrase
MRRMTLGSYPLVSLETARELARQALATADRGIDPAAKRTAEAKQRAVLNIESVVERFVELHAKVHTKEWKATKRILEANVVAAWRGRSIDTISRSEAHELLDEVVTQKGNAAAREVRKHLAKLFNWAVDRGQLVANPLSGMRRPELGYVARERVLSMDELRRIWAAADETGYPFGSMVQLLILTGQRRSEVAELERSWIDALLKAVEIPASRYKTKRPHVYPLSRPAWDLINRLPKWNKGECVFSTTSGRVPVSGFSKAKLRLDTLLRKHAQNADVEPIAAWTVHDVRRSVATHMARLGIRQEHIERVLGHVVQGVAGTYNRYSYLDEKRTALELWGRNWS